MDVMETIAHSRTGTGQMKTFLGQGNTRTSAARAARRKLRDAVGDTTQWYEVKTTFVPQKDRHDR